MSWVRGGEGAVGIRPRTCLFPKPLSRLLAPTTRYGALIVNALSGNLLRFAWPLIAEHLVKGGGVKLGDGIGEKKMSGIGESGLGAADKNCGACSLSLKWNCCHKANTKK